MIDLSPEGYSRVNEGELPFEKRWNRAYLVQALLVIIFFVSSEIITCCISSNFGLLGWDFVWFLLFLLSQMALMFSKVHTLESFMSKSATVTEALFWTILKPLTTSLGAISFDADRKYAEPMRQRLDVMLSKVQFLAICGISGAVGFLAISLRPSGFSHSLKYAAVGSLVGIFYGFWILRFRLFRLHFPANPPIKFLRFLRSSIPVAAWESLLLSSAFVATAQIVLFFAPGIMNLQLPASSGLALLSAPFWRELSHQIFTAFVFILFWIIGNKIFELSCTERLRFVPAYGATEPGNVPCGTLLSGLSGEMWEKDRLAWLERKGLCQLSRQLAFYDLCLLLDDDDSWRVQSMFSKTDRPYTDLVGQCLTAVDRLTDRIRFYLDSFDVHDSARLVAWKWEGKPSRVSDPRDLFQDCQLCDWSVRSAAALTVLSRSRDAYAVAERSKSNAGVMSSLMSLLLAADALLAKFKLLESKCSRAGRTFRGAFSQAVGASERKALEEAQESAEGLRECTVFGLSRIGVTFWEDLVREEGNGRIAVKGSRWFAEEGHKFGDKAAHEEGFLKVLEGRVE